MTFSYFTEKLTNNYLLQQKKLLNEALEAGREIIDLSIAEPNFEPPFHLIESFERALKDKMHHKYIQASGITQLRERLALWASDHYGFEVHVENICTAAGGRGGIVCILQALLNPNDEVILPTPYWSGYPNIIRLVGAVPKFVYLDEDEGFTPTIEQLERAYNPKTKMIILNNPHNPTGVVWDQKTLSEILTWAEKKNIFVLADEVCMVEVFDGNSFHSMAKIKKSFKNLAVVRSFSKTIAIPGWRIGWVIAEPELIAKIATIQGSSTGGVHSVAQFALDAAWDSIDPWIKIHVPITEHRRNTLVEHLSKLHGFRTTKPQGGISAFSNIQYYLGNEVGGEVPQTSQEFLDIVFRKTGVMLSSGESIGKEGFVRFCFSQDEDIIAKAITKISSILEK
ncbi:MAG: pyridoxal phosphate-dependent aminotransferase [Brevinema sp.]